MGRTGTALTAPGAAPDGVGLRASREVLATVRLAVATAVRVLGPALGVVARTWVPVVVLVEVVALAVVGDRAVLADGELVVLSLTGAAQVALGFLAVLALLGLLVATAGCAVLTAGALLDRPVPAAAAARVAVRRLRSLVGPTAVVGLLLVAVVAVLLWPAVPSHHAYGAAAAGAAAVAVACLAVPLVVVEGGGALRRAGEVHRRSNGRAAAVALVGLLPPGLLVAFAPPWAALFRTGSVGPLDAVVVVVAFAVAVPFAAAVLTTAVLAATDRRVGIQLVVDPDGVRADLPAGAPARSRWGAAVATAVALALPVLVLGGYVVVDPVDAPVVTEHVVGTEHEWDDLALLVRDAGPPVVAATRDDVLSAELTGPTWLLGCADDPCATAAPVGGLDAPVSSAAVGPGGAIAVAGWRPDPAARPSEDRWQLALLGCPAAVCPPVGDAALIDVHALPGVSPPPATAVAMSGSRVAVAYFVRTPPAAFGVPPGAHLRLAVCEDTACARPRTTTLARFDDDNVVSMGAAPIDVAFGPGGRPVVAFLDPTTYDSDVTVASCANSACDEVALAVRGLPRPGREGPPLGLDLVVPADDRPVVGYTADPHDEAAARLAICTTPACDGLDEVPLGPPGSPAHGPALALDPAGRLLVATYDRAAGQVQLLACRDAACADRAVVPIARSEVGGEWHPGAIDLAVGPDGRPRVVWLDGGTTEHADGRFSYEARTRVLTCQRCGT